MSEKKNWIVAIIVAVVAIVGAIVATTTLALGEPKNIEDL